MYSVSNRSPSRFVGPLGFIFVSMLAVLTGRCVIPQPNHFQVHHGFRHLQSKVSRGGSDYVRDRQL